MYFSKIAVVKKDSLCVCCLNTAKDHDILFFLFSGVMIRKPTVDTQIQVNLTDKSSGKMWGKNPDSNCRKNKLQKCVGIKELTAYSEEVAAELQPIAGMCILDP